MNTTPQREITRRERLRAWLFSVLFAAEYRRQCSLLQELQVIDEITDGRYDGSRRPTLWHPVTRAVHELWIRCRRVEAQARKPVCGARLKVEGLMSEELAEQKLAGTAESPTIKAIVALLNHKIVALSDGATNPPSESFTVRDREFESGGAHYAAEILELIQNATETETPKTMEPAGTS